MSSVAEPTAPQSAHKRRVNDLIYDSLHEAAQPIAFFCECDSQQCFQPVWLTPSDYEQIRPTRPVRAAGH
jgi:hypothetical protein